MKHSFATYEQTKDALSFFYPERLAEEDGLHTKPSDLKKFFEGCLVDLYILFNFTRWSCILYTF